MRKVLCCVAVPHANDSLYQDEQVPSPVVKAVNPDDEEEEGDPDEVLQCKTSYS